MILAAASTGLFRRWRCAMRIPSGIPISIANTVDNTDQPEMFQRKFEHLPAVVKNETENVHDAPRFAADSSPSPNART